MTGAFVFVDESGNPSRSDWYSLAGTWCLTDYDDATEILKPTRDRIANTVTRTDGELKGERMGTTKLDSVITYTSKILGEDGSIRETDVWGTDVPVAFTLYETDSDTGRMIARQHLGEGANATVTTQVIALASVTSPLLRLDNHTNVDLTDFRVILDSTTWERAGTVLEGIYDSFDWAPAVTFSCKDSRSVPGIQISDIAAHARRRRLTASECHTASSVIDEMRL